jgi:hypothetical protein
MEYKPIFIAGADRSGTSLLYALLASHPNISMVRRTNMWRYFYGRFGDLRDPENFELCLETMLRYKRLHHLEPDPDRIRAEFWNGEPGYGHLFALFHAHLAEKRGRVRWGDKSLHTEHYAEQVFSEYPQAKIIHMIRDPRDRYASILKRYDTERRRLGSGIGRWLLSSDIGEKNLQRFPDRYRILRYETLAQEPEMTLQVICDFIGEEYDPVMLTMQGSERHKSGNSSYGNIEPGVISTKSIGRYRQALKPDDYWFMQVYLAQSMARHNYILEPIDASATKRLRFYLVDLPLNSARVKSWMRRAKRQIENGEPIPVNRLTPISPNGNAADVSPTPAAAKLAPAASQTTVKSK